MTALQWLPGRMLLGGITCLAIVGYVRQPGHGALYVAIILPPIVAVDIWAYRTAIILFPSRAARLLIGGAFAVAILSAFGTSICLISRICPVCCTRGTHQQLPPALRFAGPVALLVAIVSCAALAIVVETRDPRHRTRRERYCTIAVYAVFAAGVAAVAAVLLAALAASR